MQELRTPVVWLTVPDVLVPRDFLEERMPALVRGDLNRFLRQYWTDPEAVAAREQIVREAGASSLEEWVGGAGTPPEVMFLQLRLHVQELLDRGKSTPGLQRLLRALYYRELRDGRLGVPLCDDASTALSRWKEAGLLLQVIHPWPPELTRELLAQGLDADLTRYVSTCWPLEDETSPETWRILLIQAGLAAGQVTLITAEAASVIAAAAAGLETIAVQRDGEAGVPTCRWIASLTNLIPGALPGL
jgi:methionine salvage enolase-phosphatase E1